MTLFQKRIYLDAAAATPVSKNVLKAFAKGLSLYGNPSAPHREGKTAHDLLELSRGMVATELGVKKDAVIFTGTATEANAIALLGHVRSLLLSRKAKDIHVLYSPVSHASVIETMQMLKEEGCIIEELVLKDNAIDLSALKQQIQKETVIVSVDYVCGETGTVFKTRDIRRVLDTFPAATRPLLHVDASQAPLVESMVMQHIGADFLTFDAQKIGGVRGVGVLVARRSIRMLPLYGGGGQERQLRSGTVSPALAYSCAVALCEAQKERNAFRTKSEKNKQIILEGLTKLFPSLEVNGGEETAPHILNVSCLGYDTDYLVAVLDSLGCAVSTKSACETNAVGSRVVLAFTGDAERASATLRISFHQHTTQSDSRTFLRLCTKALTVVKGAW